MIGGGTTRGGGRVIDRRLHHQRARSGDWRRHQKRRGSGERRLHHQRVRSAEWRLQGEKKKTLDHRLEKMNWSQTIHSSPIHAKGQEKEDDVAKQHQGVIREQGDGVHQEQAYGAQGQREREAFLELDQKTHALEAAALEAAALEAAALEAATQRPARTQRTRCQKRSTVVVSQTR